MKKLLLVTILLGTLLTGCSGDIPEFTEYENTEYFKTLSEEDNGEIIYDTRTGVEYWKSWGYSHAITVLVDADGKPLIYKKGD